MTIDQILSALREAKPDASVYFDFCDLMPTTIQSWRGIYSEPAIGWAASEYWYGKGRFQSSATPTVATMIAELERAISGVIYSGYKGGDYRYNGSHTLHVDNYGESTNTEIVGIEDADWRVNIQTARRP